MKEHQGIKLVLLSILSGAIFALAWPAIGGFSLLLFLAFIPLLRLEQVLVQSKRSTLAVFAHAYLAFFIFNFFTTWWIKNADLMGASMAVLCNSFFMATVFWLFHLTKKYVGKKEGYLAFVIYWLAFEYMHLNWELSWTWLNLGNGLANLVSIIQWYEFTGALGGSLWVLTVNLLLFQYLNPDLLLKQKRRAMIVALVVFSVPLIASQIQYYSYKEKGAPVEFVVVQPNIDPYTEKFGGIAPSDQIDRMLELARREVGTETDYLIFPETAFPEAYWEHELEYLYGTEELRKLIDDFPKLKVIVGLSTSILYTPGMQLSETANAFRDGSGHYDNYNTAIQIDSSKLIHFHHKSKLVLGVEKLPFIRSIPLMKKLSINLGGTSGGLGTQETPSVFASNSSEEKVAPIICYESIFGEYVNQYTRKGATIFAIVTNDGWWGNTPGYKQHLSLARLRAIENRRSIARSANTGTSAFINQRGDVLEPTKWWEQAVIKASIQSNDALTFYTKHGDYIGRVMAFIAPLLLLLTLVKKLNKTEQRLNRVKP